MTTVAERFAYSPITDRPRLAWPGGARVALWVVPNIEHYEYVPERVRVRNPWSRSPAPDVLGYGIRDYGNRVGVWRLMDVLDRLGIRCTVSLSLAVLERYPEILREMEARRWEYMSHGYLNTRYHWNLTEDEERAEIALCQSVHERLTGRRMAGWFSPAASFTLATPDLVAEAGFRYYCDFYHDDQPCPVNVRAGRLVSLPYSMEVNDSIAWARGLEGPAFETMVRDAFDTLYAEGATSGRVMCVAVHPFIMGQPHRIRYLERALAYVLGHPGVWCATGEEIVDAYLRGQGASHE
jgi:peptidoglycan/xylan/chitin deacetylase (PgdA/CDA1 family)